MAKPVAFISTAQGEWSFAKELEQIKNDEVLGIPILREKGQPIVRTLRSINIQISKVETVNFPWDLLIAYPPASDREFPFYCSQIPRLVLAKYSSSTILGEEGLNEKEMENENEKKEKTEK